MQHSPQLSSLETLTDQFITLLTQAHIDRGSSPLGPDEWSPTELLEHIVLAEEGITSSIESAHLPLPKKSIKHHVISPIVSFIMNFGIKVPVPTEKVEPTGVISFEDLKVRLKASRNRLEKAVLSQNNSNLLAFDHPVSGPQDVKGSVRFLELHLKYHFVRLQRLLRR